MSTDDELDTGKSAPVRIGWKRGRWRLVAVPAAAGATAVGLLFAPTAGAATRHSAKAAHTSAHTRPAREEGVRPGGPPPGGGSPPAAVGSVTAVDTSANSFTLSEKDGTSITVDVSSSTTYLDPTVTSPTLANVNVGEQVAVFGTNASGTVTATSVGIGVPAGGPPGGPGGPGGSPPAAVGSVTAVDTSANSFTLSEKDGTSITVDVSSSTTYLDPTVTSPTLANVNVGEQVAVFGTNASGTVTATSVGIGVSPTPKSGGSGRGGPGGGPGGFGPPPGGPSNSSGSTSSS